MSRYFKIIVLVLAIMVAGSTGIVAAQSSVDNDMNDFDVVEICSFETDDCFFALNKSIENGIVEIDTTNGTVAHFSDIRDHVNLDFIRGMDLVVPPGQHIRSTEPLDGYLWIYPPESEYSYAYLIEYVVSGRDYRASYDVPVGTFYADWMNTGVFEAIDS